MTHQRYILSFLLSTLISLVVCMGVFSLLDIEKKLQAPKKEHLVKVALLSLPKPVKKVVPKPIEPKKIVPPTLPTVKEKSKPKPIPKKIVKKHKPKKEYKKIVKKVIKKHKPKPKKIIKKYKPKKVYKKIVKKVTKKHKPKKIAKKAKPKPQKVHKRVVKNSNFKEATASQQIIEEPMPITQPTIKTEPKVIKSTPKTLTTSAHNGRAKRAFLQKVRNKIIANKKYPKIALRRHIESDVKVRFDITATGQVSNIRFISGKRVFYKSIRTTLANTFPVAIPSNMRGQLPISDVSVVLHFNIR